MTNSNEQTTEEQKRPESELTPVAITLQGIAETDQRHYAPLHIALPNESEGYEWKRETGDIQSYQHNERGGWLHIDPQGQFYDRQAQPIVREQALEHAGHTSALVVNDNTNAQSAANSSNGNDQGLSY
jgi:hypothetical protein